MGSEIWVRKSEPQAVKHTQLFQLYFCLSVHQHFIYTLPNYEVNFASKHFSCIASTDILAVSHHTNTHKLLWLYRLSDQIRLAFLRFWKLNKWNISWRLALQEKFEIWQKSRKVNASFYIFEQKLKTVIINQMKYIYILTEQWAKHFKEWGLRLASSSLKARLRGLDITTQRHELHNRRTKR